MKSILLSVQPQHCADILNKMTIKVHKTRPKLETPFKCYIYETNKKEPNSLKWVYGEWRPVVGRKGRGKVIGEFVCDQITTYSFMNITPYPDEEPTYDISDNDLSKTCLSFEEFENYGKGKPLYGWHISDLKIYDTPKELWEFKYPCPEKVANHNCSCGFRECKHKVLDRVPYECDAGLTRPPQSWCYVEELEERK